MTQGGDDRLGSAVASLSGVVEECDFRLPGWQADHWMSARDSLNRKLSRIAVDARTDGDRAAIIAIIGATGSGKSTLLNSLARAPLSRTGKLRPTTPAPIIWTARGRTDVLEAEGATYIESGDPLLDGVVLVDAPDFDSTVSEHRVVAEGVLEASDLCVFVTSAKRYADEAGWTMLRLARRQQLPIYFVLNRLPASGTGEILDHYARSLRGAGLLLLAERPRMLLIDEQPIDPLEERVPEGAVRPLSRFLRSLGEINYRRTILHKASRGRCRTVAELGRELAAAVEEEAAVAAALGQAAEAAFEVAVQELGELLDATEYGDAEALADEIVRLAESAATATRIAWATVRPGSQILEHPSIVGWDAGETTEAARKAAAAWLGTVPADRSEERLTEVLAGETARFADLARSYAQPAYRAERLRTLSGELEKRAGALYA